MEKTIDEQILEELKETRRQMTAGIKMINNFLNLIRQQNEKILNKK